MVYFLLLYFWFKIKSILKWVQTLSVLGLVLLISLFLNSLESFDVLWAYLLTKGSAVCPGFKQKSFDKGHCLLWQCPLRNAGFSRLDSLWLKSQVSRLLLLLLYRRKGSFYWRTLKRFIPINGPEKIRTVRTCWLWKSSNNSKIYICSVYKIHKCYSIM